MKQVLILSLIFSLAFCGVLDYAANNNQKAQNVQSAAYLNNQASKHADSRAQNQAASAAYNAKAAAQKAAYYAAGQTVSQNANANRAQKALYSNVNSKAALQSRRGSKKVFKNYYNKISTSSDINCRKLKRFEKEIKKTYYNAAAYQKKVVYQDVQVLRKAKITLQSIIAFALKQAYIKSGYQNKAAAYKNANQHQQANSAAYNLKKQGNLKKSAASVQNLKGGYKFFFVQKQKMVEDKLSKLKTVEEEKVEYTKLIQGVSYRVKQICNRYQKTMTSVYQNSCQKLNRLATHGQGHDYCQKQGLQIGAYIKEGYLARSQLCHAGSSLKYLKQIYSGVYDLYSGYRSQYLNKAYGMIYARRKNICSQDQVHKQIWHSTVAKSASAQQQAKSARYGNKQVLNKRRNQAQKASYLNKYKRASGNSAAVQRLSARQQAKANRRAQASGQKSLLNKQRAYRLQKSVTARNVLVGRRGQLLSRGGNLVSRGGKVPLYHFLIQNDLYNIYSPQSNIHKRQAYGNKRSLYGNTALYRKSGLIGQYGQSRKSGLVGQYGQSRKSGLVGKYGLSRQSGLYNNQILRRNRYQPKYRVVVYPRIYQKKVAALKKLRIAYKQGYKSGLAKRSKISAGSAKSGNYYYSGYFLQEIMKYQNPKSYRNTYKNNKAQHKAYKHGLRNGYKRAAKYEAIRIRKSSWASGYNTMLNKKRNLRKYNKPIVSKRIAYYAPHHGIVLANKGHGYGKARVLGYSPKKAVSLRQCKSACNIYNKCQSIGYKRSQKSCRLYPINYYGAIKSGLYNNKVNTPQLGYNNHHVLYFVQSHPTRY